MSDDQWPTRLKGLDKLISTTADAMGRTRADVIGMLLVFHLDQLVRVTAESTKPTETHELVHEMLIRMRDELDSGEDWHK